MPRTKQDDDQLPLVAINQGTKQHLLKAIYFLIEQRSKNCVRRTERELKRGRERQGEKHRERKTERGKNDRKVLKKDRAYSLWLSYAIATSIISGIHI